MDKYYESVASLRPLTGVTCDPKLYILYLVSARDCGSVPCERKANCIYYAAGTNSALREPDRRISAAGCMPES